MANGPGALVGPFRAWIQGVGSRKLRMKSLSRLLGQLCCVGRPNAGVGAFLAGGYKSMLSERGHFTRAVAKGVATMLLFSLIPQKTDMRGRRGYREGRVLFVDAAEDGDRFRLGLVGDVGFYKSCLCPRWV